VLLKQIGAGIIVLGIFVGMVAVQVCSPGTWCEKYGPAAMFVFFVAGASIGVAGFISSAIQRAHVGGNKSTMTDRDGRVERLLSAMFRELRRFRYRG